MIIKILTFLTLFAWFNIAVAEETKESPAPLNNNEFVIVIKDHKFTPQSIDLPKDIKIKLIIDNQDDSVEEFESYDLGREKIVKAHSKITVYIGPLNPGKYKFFGEFHQDTAQGVIIVK